MSTRAAPGARRRAAGAHGVPRLGMARAEHRAAACRPRASPAAQEGTSSRAGRAGLRPGLVGEGIAHLEAVGSSGAERSPWVQGSGGGMRVSRSEGPSSLRRWSPGKWGAQGAGGHGLSLSQEPPRLPGGVPG